MFGNEVLDIALSPWAANALFTAVQLRIFTLLAGKKRTVEELAAAVGAVPKYLEAVLTACAAMGFLSKEAGYYANTQLAHRYLVDGNPLYLGDFIEVLSAEAGIWAGLYDLVTAGEKKPGTDAAVDIPAHRFTMAMNNLAMLGEAEALAAAVDLSGCKTLVDVGCGSGLYSVFLCRKNPHLHALLLDKKEVLQTTAMIVEKSKAADRIKLCEADIGSDSYGTHKDAVLLSDVLYQDESTCLTMLKSAFDALTPGGTLIVRGYYSDPGGTNPLFGSLFNIHQLLFDPKREIISVSILHRWLEQTGFKNINSFPLTERSTCLFAKR